MRTRLDLRDPAGPDRLLDLLDRRVADRLPRREAVAQAQEGDVAVAVVRRLREDGQDELAERVAVRRHDRARRRSRAGARAARARGAPAARQGARGTAATAATGRRTVSWRAACPPPSEHTASSATSRSSGATAATAPGPARRPVLYLHGVPTSTDDWARVPRAAPAASRPTCPASAARGKRGDGDFTIEGYAHFVERFLDLVGVDRVRLVVHDWGAVGLRLGPAPPRARRAPRRHRRRPAAARLPLAPHRARVAHARRRRAGHGRDDRASALRRTLAARTARRRRPGAHFDQGTQRAILRLYRTQPGGAPGRAPARGLGALDLPGARRLGRRTTPTSRRASPTPTRRRSAAPADRARCPTPATGRGTTAPTSSTGVAAFLDALQACAARFRPTLARTAIRPRACRSRSTLRASRADTAGGTAAQEYRRPGSGSASGTTAGTAATTCPATASCSRRWRRCSAPRLVGRAGRGGRGVAASSASSRGRVRGGAARRAVVRARRSSRRSSRGRLTFALGARARRSRALLAATRAAAWSRAALARARRRWPARSPRAFLALARAAWWLRRGGAAARAAPRRCARRRWSPRAGARRSRSPSPRAGRSRSWPRASGRRSPRRARARGRAAARAGACCAPARVLYALALVASFVARHADGRQRGAARARCSAGPLSRSRCCGRARRRALALLAVPLLYWQWLAPVDDWSRAAGDPSVRRGLLRRRCCASSSDAQPASRSASRSRSPTTTGRRAGVAPHVPLARGWERQLDRKVNGALLRRRAADRRRATARWLDENAVALRRAARRAARLLARPPRRGSSAPAPAVPARGLARRALAALRGRATPRRWPRRRAPRHGSAPTASTLDAPRAGDGRPARPLHARTGARARARLRRRGPGDWTRRATCDAPGASRLATGFALGRDPRDRRRAAPAYVRLSVLARHCVTSGRDRIACRMPVALAPFRRGSSPTARSTSCGRCCSSPSPTTPTASSAGASTTRRAPPPRSRTPATSSRIEQALGPLRRAAASRRGSARRAGHRATSRAGSTSTRRPR